MIGFRFEAASSGVGVCPGHLGRFRSTVTLAPGRQRRFVVGRTRSSYAAAKAGSSCLRASVVGLVPEALEPLRRRRRICRGRTGTGRRRGLGGRGGRIAPNVASALLWQVVSGSRLTSTENAPRRPVSRHGGHGGHGRGSRGRDGTDAAAGSTISYRPARLLVQPLVRQLPRPHLSRLLATTPFPHQVHG